jgi:hypothetical protein
LQETFIGNAWISDNYSKEFLANSQINSQCPLWTQVNITTTQETKNVVAAPTQGLPTSQPRRAFLVAFGPKHWEDISVSSVADSDITFSNVAMAGSPQSVFATEFSEMGNAGKKDS